MINGFEYELKSGKPFCVMEDIDANTLVSGVVDIGPKTGNADLKFTVCEVRL